MYVGPCPEYNPMSPDDTWHPYTECIYTKAPLRRHGISLLENIVPLQRRLNSLDSLIILSRMTNASPQWLDPIGSGIPEGYHSGRPGQVYKYRPVGANGHAPQRLPGMDLPPGVYEERKNTIVEMHQIASDNEVMSGNQPSGVSAATALNILLEQSFSK